MTIDWGNFAKENNLSVEEFENEILTVAIVIASMKIDRMDVDEYISSVDIGVDEYEMRVRKVDD